MLPLPQSSLRHVASLAGNHAFARVLCCSALDAIGRLEILRQQTDESLIVSSDDGTVELRAPSLQRPRHRDGAASGSAADAVPMPGRFVALSAPMRRCLALLRRTRCAVLVEAEASRRAGGAGPTPELAEPWDSLADKVDCGQISSVSEFGRRGRALLEDIRPHAAVARRFEEELVAVEVPEIPCGRFELGHVRGPALVLEVELVVELSQASGPWSGATLTRRWAWAEVSVSSPTGLHEASPSFRIDRALAQPASAASSTGKVPGAAVYKHRWAFDHCGDVAAARMLSMLEGSQCTVHVSLRVDWPVLLSSRLRLRGCNLTLGSLCAPTFDAMPVP